MTLPIVIFHFIAYILFTLGSHWVHNSRIVVIPSAAVDLGMKTVGNPVIAAPVIIVFFRNRLRDICFVPPSFSIH